MAYRPGLKYQVRAFTSVEQAYLDAIEPFLGEDSLFASGPAHKTLKLRPRELFGLIIIAHVQEFLTGEKWLPGTDPMGHDGVVIRAAGERQGEGRIYEQVYVPEPRPGQLATTIEESVLAAIKRKADKGEAYRDGTDLIVFVNRRGAIGDLRALADAAGALKYDTVYLIAQYVPKNGPDKLTYLCAILSRPDQKRGPIEVKINRQTGGATVRRVTE